MKARDILIAFNIQYKGNWDKIYSALKNREVVDKSLLKSVDTFKYITLVDEEYPGDLKQALKPLFVYEKGKDMVSVSGIFYERDKIIKKLKNKFDKITKKLLKSKNESRETIMNYLDILQYINDQLIDLQKGQFVIL